MKLINSERETTASGRELPAALVSIDVLRGVAALSVVLLHAAGLFWRGQSAGGLFDSPGAFANHLLRYGFYGVNLFFVISGFCIHLPQTRNSAPLNLRAFAIRRFFRLYPLYLATTVGLFVLLGVSHGTWGKDVNATNFLFHLAFWYGANSDPSGISPVFWTLAIEVQFYVLYVFVFPLIRRWGAWRLALVFLLGSALYRVLLGAMDVVPGSIHWLLTPRMCPVARFGEWLIGAAIAEWLQKLASSSAQLRTRGGWLWWVGGFASALAVFTKEATGIAWLATDLMMSLGLACVVLLFVARELGGLAIHSRLSHCLRWLGERSYSLYLLHFTVLASAFELYCRLRGVTDKDSTAGQWMNLVPIVGGIAAAIGLSHLAYLLVEKPSHELGRRWSRRVSPRV